MTTLHLTLTPTTGTKPRNVVFLLLESIQARAVTPYRPSLPTTPFLARLAEQSIVADRAYTIVPHTSKSLISILCGVEPYLDLSMVEALPGAIPARCLPELLRAQGYRTAFYQSATRDFERRPDLLENMGFDEFVGFQDLEVQGFEEVNYFGYEDRVLVEPSLDWAVRNPSQPFFLTYLTVTTHHPYQPPRHHPRRVFSRDSRMDSYLNAVSYTDRFIEDLIEGFRVRGLYEDTMFVIVADHGEGFGEHGRFAHDTVIYEEGVRVPLLVHVPGRFEGGVRVAKPVNHLDLVPTVVDLLDYRVEGGSLPGESLLAPESDRSLKAYCFYEFRCMAVTRGRWKYIHHFGDRADELFDVVADPGERVDLAASMPGEVERARADGYEWLGRVRASYRKYMENGFQAR
jgi:arylsulfatase A-like enzyme